MGTLFVVFFWQALASSGPKLGVVRAPDPGPVAYLNPFLAQADVAPADVLCASDSSLRYYCLFRSTFLLNQNGVFFGSDPTDVMNTKPAIRGVFGGANAGDGVVPPPDGAVVADVAPQFQPPDTALWPKTVIAWIILSAIFLVLSVQFVSPTRRWRLRRGPRPGSNA
jgi:hypothetical protein